MELEYINAQKELDDALVSLENGINAIGILDNNIEMGKLLITSEAIANTVTMEITQKSYDLITNSLGIEGIEVLDLTLEEANNKADGLLAKIIKAIVTIFKKLWKLIKTVFKKLKEFLFSRKETVSKRHSKNEDVANDSDLDEDSLVAKVNEDIVNNINSMSTEEFSLEKRASLGGYNLATEETIKDLIKNMLPFMEYHGGIDDKKIDSFREYIDSNIGSLVEYNVLTGEYLDFIIDDVFSQGKRFDATELFVDYEDTYLRDMLKTLNSKLYSELETKYDAFRVVTLLRDIATVIVITTDEKSIDKVETLELKFMCSSLTSCGVKDVKLLTTSKLMSTGIQDICDGMSTYIARTMPNELKHAEVMSKSAGMDLDYKSRERYEISYLKDSLTINEFIKKISTEIQNNLKSVNYCNKILNDVSQVVTSAYMNLTYIQAR